MRTHSFYCLFATLALLSGSLFCLTACQDDDNASQQSSEVLPEVLVLFSTGGLGDASYNDQVLRGIKLMENEHSQKMSIRYIIPKDLNEAEKISQTWRENAEQSAENSTRPPRRLLVLAASDYVAMARRVFAGMEMNINRSVLMFETKDNGDETEQLRSFDIDMYGAAWLAGRTVQEMGCQQPLVLLGCSIDESIHPARDGFMDGFSQGNNNTSAKQDAISDDWNGYSMPTELYRKMYNYDGQHDFIFSVAGGTNMGAYRYLRENPECGIYTAGMDIDQSPYSTHIVGSVIKRIDLVLYDHLNNWYNQKDLPRHEHFGLESGYIDWQIADRYSYLKAGVEANRQEAIRKEKEYEAR